MQYNVVVSGPQETTGSGTSGHGANVASPGDCLLIIPRCLDAPRDLADGLARRHVKVAEVNDAPSAMVALARSPFRMAILVEPANIEQADLLVEAVRRYFPRLPVWQYRWDHTQRLTRYPLLDAPNKRPERIDQHRPEVGPPAGDTHDPPLGEDRGGEGPLLSREELIMLLDDRWEDQRESKA